MEIHTLKIDTKILVIIIIGISLVLFFINYSMTQTIVKLRLELHKNCPLPPEACPYKSSIPIESVFGYIFASITGVFGLFLILATKQREIEITKQRSKLIEAIKSLSNEEKKIYEIIRDSDGIIFQSDLILKSGFSKVKVSRILDKLEIKGIVERRRRGMSNIIILKI
jgi:hypothetical protein